MKKILIIENSDGVTGAFKSIYNNINLLQQELEFIFVIPKQTRTIQLLKQSNIRFLEFKLVELRRHWRSLFYIFWLIINARKINNFLKKEGINMVHINDLYNMLGVVLKMINPKLRIIYHVRLLKNSYVQLLYKYWQRSILRYGDQIICVSQAVQKDFPTSKKVTVIHDNMGHVPEISEENRAATNNEEQINLLCVANFTRGKGQDLIVEAFQKAFQQDKRLRLRFVGDTLQLQKNEEFRKELQERIRQYGLGEVTQFVGFQKDMSELYERASIVLQFSMSESFSMVCLEAMFYEKPLICSDCGGPAELTDQGKYGLLLPTGDIDALTKGILQLAQNKEKRVALAQSARKHAMEVFHPQKLSQELKEVYLDANCGCS